MSFLNKDDIFGCNQFPEEVVDVVEWGGLIRVRALSARGFKAVSRAADGDDETFAVHLVAASIVDEKDERVFGLDDVNSLMNAQWAPIGRIFRIALRLNGYGENAIEDAVKNSDGTPLSDSGASSPSPSESRSES